MKSSSVGVMRAMAPVKLCVLLSISYLLINGIYSVTAAEAPLTAPSSVIKSTPKKSQLTAHKTRHKHGQQLRVKDNSLWDLFNDYQRSIVPANERFAHSNNSRKVVWKKQDKSPPNTRLHSKKQSVEHKYNYETGMTPLAQINNSIINNNPSSRYNHNTRNHLNNNVLVNKLPIDNKDQSRVHYKTMQHIITSTIRTTTTVKYNHNNDDDDDEDYLDDTTIVETASIRTASARSYRVSKVH